MRSLRHLMDRRRTVVGNRNLGLLLAFNAGAINAGGFLVVQLYTSHMTGIVAMLADHLVLGNVKLVLGAIGALWAFMSGAGTTAIMVHWARHRHLRSTYALPLFIEAVLLLLFGLMGAITLSWPTPFAVPLTVLLLAFLMGLQNAVVTKMSSAQIRTTHVTGTVTDLGIELGKALFWNKSGALPQQQVRANRERLWLHAALLVSFLAGCMPMRGRSCPAFLFPPPRRRIPRPRRPAPRCRIPASCASRRCCPSSPSPSPPCGGACMRERFRSR